jgi:predicted nucleic acid-binding OB-fold protein
MAAVGSKEVYDLFGYVNEMGMKLDFDKKDGTISKLDIKDLKEKVEIRKNRKNKVAYISRHFIRNTDTFTTPPEELYYVNPEIQKMWEFKQFPKILKQRGDGDKIKDLNDLEKILKTKKLFIITKRLKRKQTTFKGTKTIKGTRDAGVYVCFMFYVEYVRANDKYFYFNMYYDLGLEEKLVHPDGKTPEEFFVDKNRLFKSLSLETMNETPDLPDASTESIFELDTKWITRKFRKETTASETASEPTKKSMFLWLKNIREPGNHIFEKARNVFGIKTKKDDVSTATGRKTRRHKSKHLRKTRRHHKSKH